jgi:hypothetical protein
MSRKKFNGMNRDEIVDLYIDAKIELDLVRQWLYDLADDKWIQSDQTRSDWYDKIELLIAEKNKEKIAKDEKEKLKVTALSKLSKAEKEVLGLS